MFSGKKLIVVCVLMVVSVMAFASDVGNYLQAAIEAYESGDTSTAIKNIDFAKKIIEQEQLSSASHSYIEVSKWDIITLKKSEYIGKKIKIKGDFWWITANGQVTIKWIDSYSNCTFDDSCIDAILSLEENKNYTFYGTVMSKYSTPYLHIEAVE